MDFTSQSIKLTDITLNDSTDPANVTKYGTVLLIVDRRESQFVKIISMFVRPASLFHLKHTFNGSKRRNDMFRR